MRKKFYADYWWILTLVQHTERKKEDKNTEYIEKLTYFFYGGSEKLYSRERFVNCYVYMIRTALGLLSAMGTEEWDKCHGGKSNFEFLL